MEALCSGAIAGAGLDVFETEPLPADSPLWEMDNVLVSPHMSGDFEGYAQAIATLFLSNFARYRNGEPLRNIIDKTKGFAASWPAMPPGANACGGPSPAYPVAARCRAACRAR